MTEWKHLPARQRPTVLAQFIPILQKWQRYHPAWIEVPNTDKSFDSLASDLRESVKGWMLYQWETPLDLNFFQQHWESVSLKSYKGSLWIAPRTEKEPGSNAQALSKQQSEGLLAFWQELPSDADLRAAAQLLNNETLMGEIRCAKPFPEWIIAEFDNVETFKPDNCPYWVMM